MTCRFDNLLGLTELSTYFSSELRLLSERVHSKICKEKDVGSDVWRNGAEASRILSQWSCHMRWNSPRKVVTIQVKCGPPGQSRVVGAGHLGSLCLPLTTADSQRERCSAQTLLFMQYRQFRQSEPLLSVLGMVETCKSQVPRCNHGLTYKLVILRLSSRACC